MNLEHILSLGNFLWVVGAAIIGALFWIFKIDSTVKESAQKHKLSEKRHDKHEERIERIERTNIRVETKVDQIEERQKEQVEDSKKILNSINQIQLHLARFKTREID